MVTVTMGLCIMFLAVTSLISGELEIQEKMELQWRFFSGYVKATFAVAVRFLKVFSKTFILHRQHHFKLDSLNHLLSEPTSLVEAS